MMYRGEKDLLGKDEHVVEKSLHFGETNGLGHIGLIQVRHIRPCIDRTGKRVHLMLVVALKRRPRSGKY